MSDPTPIPPRWANLAVIGVALLVAVVSSRPWVGAWNDGSRLATVEALGDEHTLVIDHSVFVRAGEEAVEPTAPPGHGQPPLRTKDKLLIDGHFYSDKSPVPALVLAGPYQIWKWATGQNARDDVPGFVYAMTLASSGLAYVVAVWSVFQVGLTLGLRLNNALLLAGSFGLATVAPVYARHVNNHMLLLGVSAALVLCLVRLARAAQAGPFPWELLLAVGNLAGLGYAIDLGTGPPLLACTVFLVAYRCGSLRAVLLTGVAALPWLVLNHAMNYATGGTFKPANAVPEYLAWPGSPFDATNMTGMLNHASVGRFAKYAVDLLVGQRGFLGHDLALYLAVVAVPLLLLRRVAERPEVVFAVCWSGGTWLLYSLTSTNHAGLCCSVRWFVPLLAPGYLVLALVLRELPRYRADFLILSGWGLIVTAQAWIRGPWQGSWLAIYWPVYAAAIVSWAGYRWYARRETEIAGSVVQSTETRQTRAA